MTATASLDPAATAPRPDDLTDDALVAAFEGEGFAPGSFHHRDHVRVAWALLERHAVLDVLARFTSGLRRLAAAAGKPGLYHETITWAYVLLVQERRAARGSEDWATFAARQADLLQWRPSVLETTYYREETLWSDRARAVFVLPDGAPRA
jgi:hypothetical protein